jgi:hypothetical protein
VVGCVVLMTMGSFLEVQSSKKVAPGWGNGPQTTSQHSAAAPVRSNGGSSWPAWVLPKWKSGVQPWTSR